MRPGLERTAELLRRLGHPERGLEVVHVAGTNGKGSTAALIAAGLQAAGVSTGLYTSPDLGDVRERVRHNGRLLATEDWHRWGQAVEAAGVELSDPPTEFECLTALMFLAFRERGVQVAVLEVGLGGRYDATNVVPVPAMTVLTPIALDHQEVLGKDLAAIAADKAGVIKPGGRVVSAPQAPPVRAQVAAQVRGQGARLRWASGRLLWSDASGVTVEVAGRVLRTRLLGRHQATNLVVAWTALDWMGEARGWDADAMAEGIQQASWPARLEVLPGQPLVLIDGAHNLHAAHALARALSEPHLRRPWQLVWGTLADKPAWAMLRSVLPHVTALVLTRPPGPRGQDPTPLLARVERLGRVPAVVVPEVGEALTYASNRAGLEGAVLVAGSLVLAGHARAWALGRRLGDERWE